MSDFPTRPDAALLALRPAIAGQPAAIPTPGTVADFQHQVLRPVLKLQHAVLLATVADFARDYRLPLAPAEATRLLTELLARNARLRATIAGLAVGLLTTPELAFFRQHRAELTRRLLDLAGQRVLSSLPELLTQLPPA
ncbi:hypothetical protein GKZ68_15820 [Hymenobacter sp. BRD128]|uniref:hypothetical protein n=1 Tax=Hymenobacter sp. BRD128 TaxID=2675878 RepID=UPI0015632843|nr:hypothetical protein [Hymenobacter sp. BRD128]QKG57957.1 hypothetical protein GKZ68_15820 [Hymenobacter sp. BRD128]